MINNITAKSCVRLQMIFRILTTASGSQTSLVPPHQSEVQTEPRHGGERNCCRLRTPGGALAFLLHVAVQSGLQVVKPKFLSPNSFSTMAEITPTRVFTCC